MLLVQTNRMVSGLETRVFKPQSKIPLELDAVIDTDALQYADRLHYLQAFRDGDMEIHQTKIKGKS